MASTLVPIESAYVTSY